MQSLQKQYGAKEVVWLSIHSTNPSNPDYLKPGGPKAFRARPVRVEAKDAENTEIVAGLAADEVVATGGSGLLLNELTRGIDGSDAGR